MNRKKGIKENFDSDDDYQIEEKAVEERKPAKNSTKPEEKKSDLLNMVEDTGSLFSNMTIS